MQSNVPILPIYYAVQYECDILFYHSYRPGTGNHLLLHISDNFV